MLIRDSTKYRFDRCNFVMITIKRKDKHLALEDGPI